MPRYLEDFNRHLRKDWQGSLVKVEQVNTPNARKYMSNLTKAGEIERVTHGWYWVPSDVETFYDFLRMDRNFKVVSGQSAASFWNNDFVHRDVYSLKVRDKSYAKALRSFAKRRKWDVKIEIVKNGIECVEKHGLNVEAVSDSIIECLRLWAFADALSALYLNRDRVRLKDLAKKAYWKRLPRTQVRIRQILEYSSGKMNELAEKRIFDVKGVRIEDDFVRNELDEAAEKVMEFA